MHDDGSHHAGNPVATARQYRGRNRQRGDSHLVFHHRGRKPRFRLRAHGRPRLGPGAGAVESAAVLHDAAPHHESHAEALSAGHVAAGRRVGDQRSLDRQHPFARLQPGVARVPPRQTGGLSGHGSPCFGRRGPFGRPGSPRHVHGRDPGHAQQVLRGRESRAHDRGIHRRQLPRAGHGVGRSARHRGYPPHRHPAPARVPGRLRPGRHGGAGRRDPDAQRAGVAHRDPGLAQRSFRLRGHGGRLSGTLHPEGPAHGRGRRDPYGFRGHVRAAVAFRHQRRLQHQLRHRRLPHQGHARVSHLQQRRPHPPAAYDGAGRVHRELHLSGARGGAGQGHQAHSAPDLRRLGRLDAGTRHCGGRRHLPLPRRGRRRAVRRACGPYAAPRRTGRDARRGRPPARRLSAQQHRDAYGADRDPMPGADDAQALAARFRRAGPISRRLGPGNRVARDVGPRHYADHSPRSHDLSGRRLARGTSRGRGRRPSERRTPAPFRAPPVQARGRGRPARAGRRRVRTARRSGCRARQGRRALGPGVARASPSRIRRFNDAVRR